VMAGGIFPVSGANRRRQGDKRLTPTRAPWAFLERFYFLFPTDRDREGVGCGALRRRRRDRAAPRPEPHAHSCRLLSVCRVPGSAVPVCRCAVLHSHDCPAFPHSASAVCACPLLCALGRPKARSFRKVTSSGPALCCVRCAFRKPPTQPAGADGHVRCGPRSVWRPRAYDAFGVFRASLS
jgi:hypothetical protein